MHCVGGASSQISSYATNVVSDDLAKAAIRIGTQATTSGVTDAAMQVSDHILFPQKNTSSNPKKVAFLLKIYNFFPQKANSTK